MPYESTTNGHARPERLLDPNSPKCGRLARSAAHTAFRNCREMTRGELAERSGEASLAEELPVRQTA